MRHLTIPEEKDVICGELAVPGDWVMANIATNMFWPVKAQKVAFCGVDVWLMPLMKDRYPALAIKRPPRLVSGARHSATSAGPAQSSYSLNQTMKRLVPGYMASTV
jgi:hypothetical protein